MSLDDDVMRFMQLGLDVQRDMQRDMDRLTREERFPMLKLLIGTMHDALTRDRERVTEALRSGDLQAGYLRKLRDELDALLREGERTGASQR